VCASGLLADPTRRYSPAMTTPSIDLETLRQGARLAGFAWSDAELEEIRPQVEGALRLLEALEAVALGDAAEPTTLYRTL
jgi:Asp-tRNA(Asn)/Glu-tRNA(Gln) amidotransferase C subunit